MFFENILTSAFLADFHSALSVKVNGIHSTYQATCPADDQQQSQCSDIFLFFPGLHIFLRPSYLSARLHICRSNSALCYIFVAGSTPFPTDRLAVVK